MDIITYHAIAPTVLGAMFKATLTAAAEAGVDIPRCMFTFYPQSYCIDSNRILFDYSDGSNDAHSTFSPMHADCDDPQSDTAFCLRANLFFRSSFDEFEHSNTIKEYALQAGYEEAMKTFPGLTFVLD